MATERNKDPARIQLKNVRLSFPHLWKAQAYADGEGEPKFNCNFLIDPEDKMGAINLDLIEDAIEHVKEEKWPKGAPKMKSEKICLRDGDEVEYDGYEGMMYLSASNGKKPRILDRDKQDVLEGDDGAPYAGCYVDALVRVWAQDNKWGKRINCSLEAVRFRSDGEAFGAAPVDIDEFDDLPPEEGRGRKRRSRDEDDEDEPRRKRRSRDEDDEDEPRRKRRSRDEDDEDDEPRGRKNRRSRDEDEEEEPRRKRRSRDEDDDEDEPRPRRRSRSRDEDDEI